MSTINWLANLGRRRHEPTPLPPSEYRRMLVELRMAMPADHPLVKSAEAMGQDAQQLLRVQADVYERRLEICYGVIATLGALAFVLACTLAWLMRPVLP